MLWVYKWGRIPLMCAVIGVNAYTILTPWLPGIQYKLHPPAKNFSIPVGVPAAPALGTPPPAATAVNKPAEKNTMYIPSIGLTEEVFDGDTVATLNKGAWHRPFSSTPPLGGNTVVAGHRFSYKWRWVFYNLDKVSIGDEIILDWDHLRYTYKVTDIKIVEPYDISIEQPTTVDTFTVYTCTPLVTAAHRLAIIATRVQTEGEM